MLRPKIGRPVVYDPDDLHLVLSEPGRIYSELGLQCQELIKIPSPSGIADNN